MTNRIEDIIRQREEMVRAQRIAPVSSAPDSESPRYANLLRNFLIGLVVIILIGAVGFGGYKVFSNFSSPKSQTADDVVKAVGKLIELPPEMPTVATITDMKPLAGQPFFKDAQLGDKVLIFGKAGKAVLYRPSTDKIIAIAPIAK